ncbi:MAG: glycoside hydrolase N-terminal domain-containing protein [Planctomycetota bacterium]
MSAVAAVLLLAGLARSPAAAQAPAPERRLELAAPIESWDEGLPLGNGLTGGLLWGSGGTIRLSLDRGDLWDERRPAVCTQEGWTWAAIRRLVAAGDQAEIRRLFDAPYDEPYPTKLPGGRLEIELAPPRAARTFVLDLATALGSVDLGDGALECFFSAIEPVALVRLPGAPQSLRIVRPSGLDALGYPPAAFGRDAETTWMTQEAAGGLAYAVVVRARPAGEATVLAVAITARRDGGDPRAEGLALTAGALARGWDALLAGHAAGLVEAGRSFLDQQWELLPVYRRFAREFYGVAGAAVPGVATLGGAATGGWSQYALSPTNGLWVGHSFYLHWRHTMDREFLAQRAYPWLREVATAVAALLEERGGRLVLPLSSSPEIHDNSLAAWLAPNSNYDLALMDWAFGALAEMADALGETLDAIWWRTLGERLEPLHVDPRGSLMFAAGEPVAESHRHHSHLMAIHPLGTLSIEGSAQDRAVIEASLGRVQELGTRSWVGYSFAWFACLLARAGRGDDALRYLADFERAFLLRNGFHANGDQIGAELSDFRYRPFTLEGNFLAMQAVHEMLLQSGGGGVQVFPAVPGAWADVAFDRLRAEGGFAVTAERKGGRTTRVAIEAAVEQPLRLRDPFGGAPFRASRTVERAGGELRCRLAAGERLELDLAPAGAGPRDERSPDGSSIRSLAGEWRVRLDPAATGEAERWFAASLGGQPISLPGTTDLAGIGLALDPAAMRYPVPFVDSEFPGRGPVARLDEAGHLVRTHAWIGPAWYQRTFLVPEAERGRPAELQLERVLWASRVWIDDRFAGECDSLVAPHRFEFGVLAPGPHRVTVRVDNGPVHPIGISGHAYGPETQSRWNGIVGRIELAHRPAVFLRDGQVFPAADRRSLRVVVGIGGEPGPSPSAVLVLTLLEADGERVLAAQEQPVELPPGGGTTERTLEVGGPVHAWSEHDPRRYVLAVELRSAAGRDFLRLPFGFRTVRREGRHILVNGERVFLRGTLDCCVYPRTGHPPLTVEEWLGVLGTVREHGFNHVRFHTWCPPEAAFAAADRLGIYLAPETPFWVDDWTHEIGLRPPRLGEDAAVTAYVRAEVRRIAAAYGNHPSFAFFCLGNELGTGSDWTLVDELLAEAKAGDPRRLYNATTVRRRVASDDYWVTHQTDRPVRGLGPPHTDWEFAGAVAAADLPVVAHETGQRPVFPDYAALWPKFTGPLRPYNLARLRDGLVAAGLAGQTADFLRASARFQLVQYKAEHEAFHRTADLAGYQLLMLTDFPGQSEALVGILDPFGDSKGVVTAEEVRRWNAPTVVLARLPRATWAIGEGFRAILEVAHYGAQDLVAVTPAWSLATAGGICVAAGSLPPIDVPRGGLARLGEIAVPLAGLPAAAALVLSARAGEVENRWNLWAYPPAGVETAAGDVLLARGFDATVQPALAAGRTVLLLAHGLEGVNAQRTGFASTYWSAAWWGDRFSSLGILCDPQHPALIDFPTAEHADWQWYELLEGATTILLDGAPAGFRPIVQPVSDFHHHRLLGQLFEARIGPGRLLVCGYDLEADLDRRHAARQLRRSLLVYVRSANFRPPAELDPALLARWLGR